MRSAIEAVRPKLVATSLRSSSSGSDSTLKDRMPSASACAISDRVLPTPAKMILSAGSTADARAVKWARSGDALTLDPHAQNEGPTHNVLHLIYEPLILRDRAGKL